MADKSWVYDYNACPPPDDPEDYEWNPRLRRWVIWRPDEDIDEAAVERSEIRRRKRIEWEMYHDEPCPECELE
jgi:hypothetical protein